VQNTKRPVPACRRGGPSFAGDVAGKRHVSARIRSIAEVSAEIGAACRASAA
jgi:hypothetical protein